MSERGWLMAALAVLSLSAPVTLQAQQLAAALTEEAMAALVEVHIEISAASEEMSAAIAAIHEAQAKEEAKDEYEQKTAEIFGRSGMTAEEYQRWLYVVSTDGEKRALFDRLLAEATTGQTIQIR